MSKFSASEYMLLRELLNVDKIRNALKAASSLMIVEAWCPPEHEFEKEMRRKAREMVNRMCIDALNELEGLDE